MDLKYHNIDVVLEITGSDALFHNTSILDILKSLKELSEPAGDANSGRVSKRRREEEEQSAAHPDHSLEELEASGSNQSPPHPDHSFEDLEASGSSQSPNYPHHSLEDLETGSPDTEETLAHSSPLQPLGLIRNTKDLKANGEVSWFLEAKTWKLNEDEIRKLYQNGVEKIHDFFECGVVPQSYKALSDHEKSDDHVQEKKIVENFFNSKVKAMCPICGIGAGNKTKLRNHVLSHFLWTFACPKCPKLFRSIRGYRNHSHLLKKKYACECGCWFVEKRTLRLHKTRELHRKRMAFINPQEAESIAEPETVADIMGLIMDESFPDLFQ